MPFSLSQQIIAMEHINAENTKMTGVLPQKSAPVDFRHYGGDPGTLRTQRDMLTWNRPDDGADPDVSGGTPIDGNGLFNPWSSGLFSECSIDESVALSERRSPVGRPWLMNLHVLCDPAVTWRAWLTSGLRDGSATELDDPINDVPLGFHTGVGGIQLYFDLLPYQCIRVTASTAPAGTEIYARLYLGLSNGDGGRFM